MKTHLSSWLYVFFVLFIANETVFALPHAAREFVTPNADLSSSVSGENLFQRLLEKAGYDPVSSHSPVKNAHVAIRTDRQSNIISHSEELHTAVSVADIPPVDNPVSLALLGISLMGLAGISRRTFAKKITP